MISDQEMREYADKANDDIGILYDMRVDEWELTCDKPTMQMVQQSLQWVPDALDRLDRIRALIDPSKAVKGSVASKILQILDGDDQ